MFGFSVIADMKFSMYPPSMVAAASIGAAIQGLSARLEKQWAPKDLLFRLHEITGIDEVRAGPLFSLIYIIDIGKNSTI